jgi:hypothetical protein
MGKVNIDDVLEWIKDGLNYDIYSYANNELVTIRENVDKSRLQEIIYYFYDITKTIKILDWCVLFYEDSIVLYYLTDNFFTGSFNEHIIEIKKRVYKKEM